MEKFLQTCEWRKHVENVLIRNPLLQPFQQYSDSFPYSGFQVRGSANPTGVANPIFCHFSKKKKQLTKFPGRSLQPVTINLIEHYILRVFCLFLVLLCCRRPRDGHGTRGGTPQGEWHAVRDFLWHRDWHPNVRWTQPQWHGNLQCKTFQYNRVYYVMHKVGNIGIKGFAKENFQQQKRFFR